VRLVLAIAVVAGCASSRGIPRARATDPDVCVAAEDVTNSVEGIRTDGKRVEVCYGGASCITFDVATSTVSRAEIAEQPPDPLERFELARDEDGSIALCDRHTDICTTIRIPGQDERAVPIEPGPNGNELYALVTSEDGVHYLDTYDLRSRRIGRIVIGHGKDHMFSMWRVGSAVLVNESIDADAGMNNASSTTLVAPFTGAIRRLANGHAIELDPTSILAIEGRDATIVEARTLRALATHQAPGKPVPDHSSAAGIRIDRKRAIVAFTDPPSIATIDIPARRFVSAVRLPVCEPYKSDYKRPPAPIMNE